MKNLEQETVLQKHTARNGMVTLGERNSVKFKDVAQGIVQIRLYCSKKRGFVKFGSGFVADKENGFIITSNRTVLKRENESFWHCCGDKIVIGMTSRNDGEHNDAFR